MSIAPTLEMFLAHANVPYQTIEHGPAMSAMRAAEKAHIPGARVAKAVVLRAGGKYLLAVLPASRHVSLSELSEQLRVDVQLAAEEELRELFRDCDPGAVPAVGACYGLEVVVDDQLLEQPEIYFEAGDHSTFVRVSREEFERLVRHARHGYFTVH